MDRVDYQPIIVQDLINWEKSKELNLSPWYQRRGVWTNPQKAYLINTLFEQKPVPTLYFRHTVDLAQDKSLREVVDGQQRIRAILDYLGDNYSAHHFAHQKKVKYSDLTDTQKRIFRETKLSGGFLLGASDADVIEIFGRLNSVAKTLNAQEKRNAMFSGELKQFCLRQAAEKVHLWRDLKIFSANDIARMQEVEFLSDIVFNFINGLSDFSAARLNRLYAENEDARVQEATDAALQLVGQLSTVTNLPRRYVAELLTIRLFSLFESIVEDAACRMICGASYCDGSIPSLQRRRPCRGFDQARMAMRTYNRPTPRNELRWNKASEICDNLEMLFPTTEHFTTTLLGHGNFISDLRKIRNHIAHGNQGTHRRFQDVVANRYGVRIPGMTPATMLLSGRFAPILIEQYCLQTRAVLRAALRA